MKIKSISIAIILFTISTAFLPVITQSTASEANSSNIIENKIKTKDRFSAIFDFIDKIQPGDIIIHLPGRETQYGHCRIFTGLKNDKYCFVDSYYHVLGYSLSKIGLATMLFLLTTIWRYDGIVLLRVNATSEQKQNAIDFANLQVGKMFDFNYDGSGKDYNPENKDHRTAKRWYCSELPWAAYYNCNNSFPKKRPEGGYVYGEGIDIDANGWSKDHDHPLVGQFTLVYPMDIVKDSDTQIIDSWMRI